jgi:TRAP-type C4-dicarboxylate transport system permease large subunit
VPQKIVTLILGFSNDPRMFLLCVNLLLLLAGMVMDVSANLIIFVPILAPVAHLLGINPLHFAIVVVFNLCVGMITPPVGTVLFVMCSVTKLSMESLVRELWPFIMVEIAVLGLITYAPAMTLVVPRLLGY